MFKGNLRAALALLYDVDRTSAPFFLKDPVSPDKPSWTVFDEQHHPGRPVKKEALLSPITSKPESHPVIFDVLDSDAIHHAALRTKGAADPSRVEAFCWR